MSPPGKFWIGYFLLLIAVVWVLAGCSSVPVTTEVKIPVRVECVKEAPVRPSYETESLPTEVSDGQKVLSLVRDWARSRKYEGLLEAVVEGCK